MPSTCMNIYRDELIIEVDIDYIEGSMRTWDCPGSDGVVDIVGSVDSDTGEPVELTDKEVQYVEENFFKYLENIMEEQREHDIAQDQYESQWCPL
jgi:hypothetical protein